MRVPFIWIFICSTVFYVEVYANKVLDMKCGTTGYYAPRGMTSSGNERLMVKHQDFYKGNKCIKVVKINIFGQEVECVSVECTVGITGLNFRYQFGSALLIRPDTGTNVFKGLYNLGNGDCLEKIYTANGIVEKSEGASTSDSECETLLRGRNDGRMNGVGSVHLGNVYMGDTGITFGDGSKRMRQAASADRGPKPERSRGRRGYSTDLIVNNGVFNGERRNEVLTMRRFDDSDGVEFSQKPLYLKGPPPPGVDTNGKIIVMNSDVSDFDEDLIEGLKDLHSGLSEMKSALSSIKSDFLSGNGAVDHVGDTYRGSHGTDIIVNDGIFNGERRNEALVRPRFEGSHGSDSLLYLNGSPTRVRKSADKTRGIINKNNKFDEEPNKESDDDEVGVHDDDAKLVKSSEDYEVIHTQKVAVLNDNVYGFEKNGPERKITGSLFTFTVQKYIRPDSEDCIKLVTVRKKYGNNILEKLKISCEHINPKTNTGDYIRFDGAIYENPSTYGVTYVVKDGACIDKPYWSGRKERGTKLDESACYALTRRTRSERMSGIIPDNKPITSSDIDVMDEQIVAVLDGSVKDFKEKNIQTTFDTKNFEVRLQEYVKDNQCVKVISMKRPDHDDYIDEVKVSCKITGPLITKDEDIDFNFGNVIYMLDVTKGVFVLKDGECLQRTYRVITDYTKVVYENVEKTDNILSPHECFAITRWRKNERSSVVKLNKDPPTKTLQTPGFMWLVAFNGVTSGYTAAGGKNLYSGGAITVQTQDFHKDPDECKRLVILSIRGVEADRFKVSCGPIINANVNGRYAKYGRAFIAKPSGEWNTYQVIFNVRKEYCLTKKYTVKWSIFYSNTIKKSPKFTRMKGQQCEYLMKENSIGNRGGPSNIGTMNPAKYSNIGNEGSSDDENWSNTHRTSSANGFMGRLFNGWRG